MKTAYASFGTPSVNDEFLVTESLMYEMGKRWALAGHKKLPVKVDLPGRPFPFPIVRSRHEWAVAFVKGWKDNKIV